MHTTHGPAAFDPADLAARLVERYGLTAADLVVEVGSGDGAMLREVRALGPRVLGVEVAAGLLARAFGVGVDTLRAAFDPAAAELIRRRYGPARVVVSGRLPVRSGSPAGFLAAVSACLAPGGLLLLRSAAGFVEVPTEPRPAATRRAA